MTLTLEKKTILILACLGLSACGADGPMTPMATEPDLVGLRLAQAAEKASSSLDTIAGIEQHRAPPMPATDDFANVPPALTQLITVKWSGPVEQMLETLAGKAGMRFDSKGSRPGVPLIVHLNVYQKPMIEVLRDLGLQVGRRGDITVNGTQNVIEVRYAPVDRT